MGSVHYNHAGEIATVSTTFAVDDDPTDPTTVTFVVTNPDGQATTTSDGDLTHGGPGIWSLDVSCASTTAGTWTAVLIGTGAASDVDVVTWSTFDTDLSRLYVTPIGLKSRKGIALADTLDDLEIMGACQAATQSINDWCDRVFWRWTGTRTFAATCGSDLDVGDLVSVTSLKSGAAGDGVFGTTWAPTDFQLMPFDAPGKRGEPWPYTQIRAAGLITFPLASGLGLVDRVEITGTFGWPQIPATVRMAAAIIAGDLLKLGTMSFGVAGYGEYGAVRARPNPIAEAMLQPYRLNPVLVA